MSNHKRFVEGTLSEKVGITDVLVDLNVKVTPDFDPSKLTEQQIDVIVEETSTRFQEAVASGLAAFKAKLELAVIGVIDDPVERLVALVRLAVELGVDGEDDGDETNES